MQAACESRVRQSRDIQLATTPEVVDLGWGQPDPDLLPPRLVADAASRVLAQDGDLALSYGVQAGPVRLRERLIERWEQQEGRRAELDRIVVTAGASHALDLIAGASARHGTVALVESPTYHLALSILRDRGLRAAALPTDEHGVIPDAVPDLLARLRRQGERPAFAYLVPTYSNPRGTCLPLERRKALVAIAAQEQLLIVEDDVYRELSFEAPPPQSLWSLDKQDCVARIGSVSKFLGPGLRVGWLAGPPALAQRIQDGGLLRSGGGITHMAAMVVAKLYASGGADAQLATFRSELSTRAAALVEAVRGALPSGATITDPDGGYFAWLNLSAELDTDELLDTARAAGVGFAPGNVFHLHGGRDTARVSFALYPREQLAAAGRLLGQTIHANSRRHRCY